MSFYMNTNGHINISIKINKNTIIDINNRINTNMKGKVLSSKAQLRWDDSYLLETEIERDTFDGSEKHLGYDTLPF